MTATLEGGEWSAARPGRALPQGKTRYPFYRRLCGPQDRSGREENLVPTGIRSRTVQPVVSSYTDWATGPTLLILDTRKTFHKADLSYADLTERSKINKKGKAVPLQVRSGPEGSRKLRFPDFMTKAQDGDKVVSLKHLPPLPPGNNPGTHFC